MSDSLIETTEEQAATGRTLDLTLQQLWEKARRVSAIVLRLREENTVLRDRIRELEEENGREGEKKTD